MIVVFKYLKRSQVMKTMTFRRKKIEQYINIRKKFQMVSNIATIFRIPDSWCYAMLGFITTYLGRGLKN